MSKDRSLLTALVLAVSLALVRPAAGVASPRTLVLPVPAVPQQASEWCWAAVSQMVFQYFGVPSVSPLGDYQCGVVGLVALGTPAEICGYICRTCNVPAGRPFSTRSTGTPVGRRKF